MVGKLKWRRAMAVKSSRVPQEKRRCNWKCRIV